VIGVLRGLAVVRQPGRSARGRTYAFIARIPLRRGGTPKGSMQVTGARGHRRRTTAAGRPTGTSGGASNDHPINSGWGPERRNRRSATDRGIPWLPRLGGVHPRIRWGGTASPGHQVLGIVPVSGVSSLPTPARPRSRPCARSRPAPRSASVPARRRGESGPRPLGRGGPASNTPRISRPRPAAKYSPRHSLERDEEYSRAATHRVRRFPSMPHGELRDESRERFSWTT
jgi:hypothetical protein